eukprot:gene8302-17068_t
MQMLRRALCDMAHSYLTGISVELLRQYWIMSYKACFRVCLCACLSSPVFQRDLHGAGWGKGVLIRRAVYMRQK